MLSEITIPLYIIYALQAFFLPIQIWNFLVRKSDTTRLRFLLLLTFFLSVNLLSLVPFTFGFEYQVILIIAGIVTIGYTYYYILKETGIIKIVKNSFFSVRNFLFLVFIVEVLRIINYEFQFTETSVFVFYFLHQSFVFIFAGKLILSLKKKGNSDPIHISAFLIGCISLFLPFVIYLLGNIELFWTLVNLPFFIIATAYVTHYFKQIRIESKLFKFSSNSILADRQNELLNSRKSIDLTLLTAREQEVAQLIIQGFHYNDIADQLFISEPSVRKHASNIFRKLKTKNLSGFRRTYHKPPK